jgi:hypothetical protein
MLRAVDAKTDHNSPIGGLHTEFNNNEFASHKREVPQHYSKVYLASSLLHTLLQNFIISLVVICLLVLNLIVGPPYNLLVVISSWLPCVHKRTFHPCNPMLGPCYHCAVCCQVDSS